MTSCPKCHHENSPEANFCSNCGTNLKEQSYDQIEPISQSTKERSAERRQLTILFCDLVGSTPLSEKLDPEEFREVITNYHQEAEKVVSMHGGYIAQYLGDGLLVYFGYPEGMEDAARVGVKTGLNILRAIDIANDRWEAAGKTRIKIRIGIHTGLVVVDDHLALGEAVNIAARLEGLAPHDSLVITPQTKRLIEGWFKLISTGQHVLKGISEPIEIYRVLEESGAKTQLDVGRSTGLSPLVGRQKEQQMLTKKWEKAKQGLGNFVLINGEAGIGKSRLLDTFDEGARKDPKSWIGITRCSAYQLNSAFYPIIQLFEHELLAFVDSESAADKLLRLEKFVTEVGLEIDTTMSILAEFLAIPSDQFPPLFISPFAKRQKLMETISGLIIGKSEIQPTVIIVEDLHWTDASTMEWLKLFTDQISGHQLFILCTTRPDFDPEFKTHENFTKITLERLAIDDIVHISHHQSKGKTLPREIINQIVIKTEGVPLFVEELTKMVIESDIVVEKENSFDLMVDKISMSIPSTLQDSFLARLDRLSNAKEVVLVGSVLGREFSLEMLKVLIPPGPFNLNTSLAQLSDAEIIYQKGEESIYEFKHALIQDAAYESLLKSKRQELHSQVAEALENQFADIIQSQPELIAHHFTEANRQVEAIPYWLKAGQMASQKNATMEAIAHLEKGIALLNYIEDVNERNNLELDLRLTLGGTYVVSHGFPHPKVKETFNRAREVAQSIEVSPKMALVLFNLLSYYFNTEEYDTHDELASYMLKLAKESELGYWFELCASQLSGCVETIKGNGKKAQINFEHVLKIFDPSLPFPWELAPSGYIEIAAKGWYMIALHMMGEYDQARKLADQHLNYANDHKDSMTLYHIYTFPVLYYLESRQWNASEKILDEYFPIVREFGDPVFNLTAEVSYNIARSFQGNEGSFEKAINLVNVCLNIGFKAFAATMAPYIAELYVKKADYKSAVSWIDKILEHVNETGSHGHTPEMYRIKALAFQGLGKPIEQVMELLNLALNFAGKRSSKTYELRAATDMVKLNLDKKKQIDALEKLRKVYDAFKVKTSSLDLEEARRLLKH